MDIRLFLKMEIVIIKETFNLKKYSHYTNLNKIV